MRQLSVDPARKQPLYQQLFERIVERVARGALEAGVQLPSVRDLAIELRINPNTVARAYRELERAGWVESQPGRGVFVAEVEGSGRRLPRRVVEALEALRRIMKDEGVSIREVVAELERWAGKGSNKGTS